MRKILSLVFVCGLVLGCAVSRVHIPGVHAQSAGQTFTCQGSNIGSPSAQCSQYLLQVVRTRGLPRFQLWQVQTQPVLIDGSNGSTFANYGAGSAINVQAFELATGTDTFTVTAAEP
jgi:hypothetical protein